MKKYYFDVLKVADTIYASSQYCADSIKNILSYNFNTKVIYVGVDEKLYFPDKTTNNKKTLFNIPDTSFVFFFLGRMDKSMGVDFLIENAEGIINIGESVHLIMAGAKGDYSSQVKELANSHDRIKYFENIPFDQKVNFYHACDVYIAPTMQKHACMGVSIKEAMACGKPI